MADLPNKNHLTSATTTEAQFQAAIGSVYDYLAQLIAGSKSESVTPLLGSITPSFYTHLRVDTENLAATDDLDFCQATNIGEKIIYIRSVSSARVVTIRNNQSGSGRFITNDALAVVLDNPNKMIAFRFNPASGGRWEELWRNWGVYVPTATDKANARTQLGLGTAATVSTGTASNQIRLNSQLGALALLSAINNTNQISANMVINNHLAGNITLNKLANNTPNSLVYYNSVGLPVVLTAPMDPNKVLNGNLQFQDIGGTGDWVAGDDHLQFTTGTETCFQNSYPYSNAPIPVYRFYMPASGTVRVKYDLMATSMASIAHNFLCIIRDHNGTELHRTPNPLVWADLNQWKERIVASIPVVKGQYIEFVIGRSPTVNIQAAGLIRNIRFLTTLPVVGTDKITPIRHFSYVKSPTNSQTVRVYDINDIRSGNDPFNYK